MYEDKHPINVLDDDTTDLEKLIGRQLFLFVVLSLQMGLYQSELDFSSFLFSLSLSSFSSSLVSFYLFFFFFISITILSLNIHTHTLFEYLFKCFSVFFLFIIKERKIHWIKTTNLIDAFSTRDC